MTKYKLNCIFPVIKKNRATKNCCDDLEVYKDMIWYGYASSYGFECDMQFDRKLIGWVNHGRSCDSMW